MATDDSPKRDCDVLKLIEPDKPRRVFDPRALIAEVFDRESVTVAPVYDIEQIMNDPHFREREIIVDLPDTEMGTVAMHNITPRLSTTPGGFTRPAPALGQHNAEVLARIGIKESDLAKLKEHGVV